MLAQEKSPPADGTAGTGTANPTYHCTPEPREVPVSALTDAMLSLLDGSAHATAVMPWGKPGPILLPDDPAGRLEIVETHLRGRPANVLYTPKNKPVARVAVPALILAAFCPASDSSVRWIGIDLDAADTHGAHGLTDPVRAMRCLAERADAMGLFSGLLAARSRNGAGRNLFLVTPGPVALADAALAVAAWGASAYRTAIADAEDAGGELIHTFRCNDGTLAMPGKAGAFELFPRSTQGPELGWALTLPAAGALATLGGGCIVDPFTDQPMALETMPRCDSKAWTKVVDFTRNALAQRRSSRDSSRLRPRRSYNDRREARERMHPLSRDLLGGRTAEGQRNTATFATVCNLVGCGIAPHEAERAALTGSLASGLSEREARSAIRSALRAKGVA